ncbi:MAG: hypothetical protein P4L46_20615 [Fimbriimonas sp.]|nr:hypothetical protein [Fimbriimonas sp.]
MKPNVIRSRNSAVWGLMLVAAYCSQTGCGGGGAATPSAPKTTNIEVGPLVAAGSGTAQPPVVSAGAGATVTGIAGTTFNSITLSSGGAKDVAKTKIAFTASDGSSSRQIYTVPITGGTPTLVTGGQGGQIPCWSPDGSKLLYSNTTGSGSSQIFSINSNGTGQPTQLTTGTNLLSHPQYGPDGTTIYYMQGAGTTQLFSLVNGVSTAVTPSSYTPAWFCVSPDGTQICFSGNGPNSQFAFQLYMVPSSGGTPTQLTSSTGGGYYPAWSPDGSTIAFVTYDTQGGPAIYTMPANGGPAVKISNAGVPSSITSLSWAADGAHMVFAGYDSLEVSGMYLLSVSTGLTVQLPSGGKQPFSPSCSPYLSTPPAILIGPGGIMGSSAAGCLLSQSGDTVNTVVTFDTGHATTASRNAARVTTQTGLPGNPPTNLIFTLTSSDGLTSLKYTKGTSGAGITTVIGSGGSVGRATSAVLSFNGTTGTVALAFTYNTIRAANATPEVNGDEVTYRGSISSVVDGQGRSLAPNGASSITINSKTGQLVRLN